MSQQTIRDVVIKVAIEAQQATLPPPDTTAWKQAGRELGMALTESLRESMSTSIVQIAQDAASSIRPVVSVIMPDLRAATDAIEEHPIVIPKPNASAFDKSMEETAEKAGKALEQSLEKSLVQTAKEADALIQPAAPTTPSGGAGGGGGSPYSVLDDMLAQVKELRKEEAALEEQERALAEARAEAQQKTIDVMERATAASATTQERVEGLAAAFHLLATEGGVTTEQLQTLATAFSADLDAGIGKAMDKTVKHFKSGTDGALKFARGLVLMTGNSKELESIIAPLMKIQGAIDLLNGGYKTIDNLNKGMKFLGQVTEGLALKQALLDAAQAGGTVTATALAGAQTVEAGAAGIAKQANSAMNTELEEQVVAAGSAAVANTANAAAQTASAGTAQTAAASASTWSLALRALPSLLNPVGVAVVAVAAVVAIAAGTYRYFTAGIWESVAAMEAEKAALAARALAIAEGSAAAQKLTAQGQARIDGLRDQQRALMEFSEAEAAIVDERESLLSEVDKIDTNLRPIPVEVEPVLAPTANDVWLSEMKSMVGNAGRTIFYGVELGADLMWKEGDEEKKTRMEEARTDQMRDQLTIATQNVAQVEAAMGMLERVGTLDQNLKQLRLDQLDASKESLETIRQQLEETRKIAETEEQRMASEEARLGSLSNRDKARLENYVEMIKRGEDLSTRQQNEFASLAGQSGQTWVQQQRRDDFRERYGGRSVEEVLGQAGGDAARSREAGEAARAALDDAESRGLGEADIATKLATIEEGRQLVFKAINESIDQNLKFMEQLTAKYNEAVKKQAELEERLREQERGTHANR